METRILFKLFLKLQAIKPAQRKMTDQEMENLYMVWGEYLEKKNITLQMIAIGLDRSVEDTSDYFPSIGKFIEWCRYIPETDDLRRSYRHACKRIGQLERWAHPVIYYAAQDLGAAKLERLDDRDIETTWRRAIESAKDKFFAGELPEIPKPETLIEQQKAEISEEQRQDNIDRLREMI